MKAITTRTLSATNTRGARIRATDALSMGIPTVGAR